MAFTTTNWVNGQSVTEVQGVGLTVGHGSQYLYDGDSTYWAVVAVPGGEETDGEGYTFKQVGTGYYPPANFVVDAPQEVLEAYAAEVAAKQAAARAAAVKRAEEQAAYEAECEAQTPRRGKTVKVVRGRKVPVGTVAEVAWYGESNYGGYRVALLIDGERVFTDASNVEVVQALVGV